VAVAAFRVIPFCIEQNYGETALPPGKMYISVA
jgi:hypothetical protein